MSHEENETFTATLLKLGTEVHTLDVGGKKETTVICRKGDAFIFFSSKGSSKKFIKAAIKRKADSFDEDTYIRVNKDFGGIDKAKHDARDLKEYLLNLVSRI